jgi:hypothetical protein
MRYEPKVSDALLFGLNRPVKTRACDCAGCSGSGEYRAPKSRDKLNEYFWFCLDHVRVYNLNWDYYAGMSEAAIEEHVREDYCWQRETWPMGSGKQREDSLKEKTREFFSDEAPEPRVNPMRNFIPAAVIAALAVLELKPPIEFPRIKAHYKILVKRHHPDANGGSKDAEAKLKDINLAFTTLRKAYEATIVEE